MRILRSLRARAFVLALLCVALGVVCALPPPTIQTAQAPYAPFGRYRTFTFQGPEGAPDGYVATRSVGVEQRMRALIGKELQQKGYVEIPEGGDFLVAYSAGSREATRTIQLSRVGVAVMGQNEEESTSLEGILVVDVYDRITKEEVWHGTAKAELGSSGFEGERLAETLQPLMAAFPAVWRPSVRTTSAERPGASLFEEDLRVAPNVDRRALSARSQARATT